MMGMTSLERAVIIAARAFKRARIVDARAQAHGDPQLIAQTAYAVELCQHELLLAADRLAFPEDL